MGRPSSGSSTAKGSWLGRKAVEAGWLFHPLCEFAAQSCGGPGGTLGHQNQHSQHLRRRARYRVRPQGHTGTRVHPRLACTAAASLLLPRSRTASLWSSSSLETCREGALGNIVSPTTRLVVGHSTHTCARTRVHTHTHTPLEKEYGR